MDSIVPFIAVVFVWCVVGTFIGWHVRMLWDSAEARETRRLDASIDRLIKAQRAEHANDSELVNAR